MFGGAVASLAQGIGAGFEDENKKSLISDIRNYFAKNVRQGGMTASIGPGQIGASTNLMLQQKDQEDIRRIYVNRLPKNYQLYIEQNR